ncbi:50S ribosomal protein L6 [Candidatus Falkowbacteria bacterium]|nr:50S ribosomal protein L6 [Candidatus Falkowbacteria bacterium]
MSRIGKKPIEIPSGIEVKINNGVINVKGPKGELNLKLHPDVIVEIKENKIIVNVKDDNNVDQRALWGLFSRLINNMVIGVKEGYEKKMEVVGVGFRVALQGNKIVLNLGFSHPVEFILPDGIKAELDKNIVTLSGIDKQLVGETAARLRRIRKPDVYKGKGIKYADEVIKKKPGKAAAKAAA